MNRKYWIISAAIVIFFYIFLWPLGFLTTIVLFAIIPAIVYAIKYFIRYHVEYQAEYSTKQTSMDELNAELDEIEKSLDRVRASEDAKDNVTAIWNTPKKK